MILDKKDIRIKIINKILKNVMMLRDIIYIKILIVINICELNILKIFMKCIWWNIEFIINVKRNR